MYHIRRLEEAVITTSTEIASLDPEKFRNLPVPYTGNSESEFIDYIFDNILDNYTDYDLDDETFNELSKLESGNNARIVVDDSSVESCNDWWEAGEIDDEYQGGFKTTYDGRYD